MDVPSKVARLFEKTKYMSFASSSRKGHPNVVAIGSQRLVSKDTIWIIDYYFRKTKLNILENDKAAICFWKDSSEGYQIKGNVKYMTRGTTFEKAKEWIQKLKPDKKVKGVVKMKVTEIFNIAAIAGIAGKKLS